MFEITGAVVGLGADAQAVIRKMLKIQKIALALKKLRCRKIMRMIVPNTKWSKFRGNKTDTITASHVDFSFLPASFCDRAGVNGVAHNPADRSVFVACCG